MNVKELSISGGGDEVEGPAYPVEVVSLHRDRQFKGTVDAMTVQDGLHKSGILKTDERFIPAGFGLIEESVLWAVRAKFEFQIQGPKDNQGNPGLMHAQTGMRPFGREFIDNDGGYIYQFNLSAPGNIGLLLPNVAEFTVPGVPRDAFPNSYLADIKADVAEKWTWVADEKLRNTLEVKKPK